MYVFSMEIPGFESWSKLPQSHCLCFNSSIYFCYFFSVNVLLEYISYPWLGTMQCHIKLLKETLTTSTRIWHMCPTSTWQTVRGIFMLYLLPEKYLSIDSSNPHGIDGSHSDSQLADILVWNIQDGYTHISGILAG